MLVVTTRNKFKPLTDPEAVQVEKYRHAQKGEPALNCRLHMTDDAALNFTDMLRTGNKAPRNDYRIATIITYSIEE